MARLFGTVVHAGPPYFSRPKRRIWRFPALIVLLPFALAVAIVVRVLTSLVTSRKTTHSSFTSEALALFVSERLFERRLDVPTRDFRLRDASSREHLIRVKGDFLSGDLVEGDYVEVEAEVIDSTLHLRRGKNFRTGNELVVKAR